MIGSSRSYAVGMAHFQLGGGYLSLAALSVVYTLIFFGSICTYVYMEATSGRMPMRVTFGPGAVSVMFVLQAVNLVIFGALRIAGAVRGDVTSRMIESHRLMPVPSWRAVAGYMLGSTAHVAAFALLTLLFAMGLAMAAGTPLTDVALKQGILLLFTGMVWSLVAMLNLFHRAAFVAATVGGVLAIFSTVAARGFALLPAMGLLTGPLLGNTIFYFGPTPWTISVWVYPVSIVGQLAFFSLFFAAACRCYRGTYRTVFTGWQALLLPVVWAGLSAAGIVLVEAIPIIQRLFYREDAMIVGKQVAASTAMAMLLSLIPIYTVSMEQRGRRGRLGMGLAATLVLSVVVGMIPMGVWRQFQTTGTQFAVTWLAVAAFLLTVFLICHLFSKATPSSLGILLAIVTFVVWVGPLAPAAIVHAMVEDPESTLAQTVATFSPVGLLMDQWTSDAPVSAAPGLAWQWFLPLLLLVYAGVRRRAKRRGESTRGPSSTQTVPA